MLHHLDARLLKVYGLVYGLLNTSLCLLEIPIVFNLQGKQKMGWLKKLGVNYSDLLKKEIKILLVQVIRRFEKLPGFEKNWESTVLEYFYM